MKIKKQKTQRQLTKSHHYDGELVQHRDGTFTIWVRLPMEIARLVATEAKKLGMSRSDFLSLAVKLKIARMERIQTT